MKMGFCYKKGAGLKAALNICFSDVNERDITNGLVLPEEHIMTMRDAKRIRRFVEGLIDKDEITELIIHCHAGISRSAAVVALFLDTCIIDNSNIPSGSMEDTIMTGDRVIGSRLSYLFSDPERGDIVIFRFPDNEKVRYVKRIIGLPGETVDITDGKVFVDGVELEETYIREPMIPQEPMHFEVPDGCYFMLGDNRNQSADSRVWENTYVAKEKIIAKVLFRYWPTLKMIS